MGGHQERPVPVYPLSGQIALGASGTVTQLPTLDAVRVYLVAHPSNSGVVWVGAQSGSVNGDTGFPLEANLAGLSLEGLGRFNYMFASPDIPNDKLCYILLDETPQYNDSP